MNVHPRLLLLQGSLSEPETASDFGPTYGNRVAFAQRFRERWQRRDEAAALVPSAANEADDLLACGCG